MLEEDFSEELFEKCDDLNDKLEPVCEVGLGCCSQCIEELEEMAECIVNKVIKPILKEELEGESQFDVDEEDCDIDCGSRRRKKARKDRFLRATIKQARRSLQDTNTTGIATNTTETADPALVACEEKFSFSLSIGNFESAMDDYVACVEEVAHGNLGPANATAPVTDDEPTDGGFLPPQEISEDEVVVVDRSDP